MEEIILVDSSDRQTGTGEKHEVHRTGALHRSFSIFIFNSRGQLLLQQRAQAKYHSGGTWSNTCCSHPRVGEQLEAATHRRLREEMGFDCALHEAFTFIYKIQLDNGFTEHEYDHVFIGHFDGEPAPNPAEVGDWQWIAPEALKKEVAAHPERYTYWMLTALDRAVQAAQTKKR